MVREDEEKEKGTNKRKKIKSSLLSTFPQGIGRLRKLKTLTLSGCGLKQIDSNLLPFLAHLEVLNLPVRQTETLKFGSRFFF